MAITKVASSSGTANSTVIPADQAAITVAVDDVLILVGSVNQGGVGTDVFTSFTKTSGTATIGTVANVINSFGTNTALRISWCRITGAGTLRMQLNLSATRKSCAGVLVLRGALSSATPVHANNVGTGTGTAADSGTAAVNAIGDWLVGGGAWVANPTGTPSTTPGTWTEDEDRSSTGGATSTRSSIYIEHWETTTTTAYGSKPTLSSSQVWRQGVLSIKAELDSALAGTAANAFANSGVLTGSGALAGNSAPVFGAGSSALTGAGALVGSAALVFSNTGTMESPPAGGFSSWNALWPYGLGKEAVGPITGTAALTFSNTGALTGAGALAGSAAGQFTNTGVLTGAGALAGTADLIFAGTNTLIGSGALAGAADMVFTPSATADSVAGGFSSWAALWPYGFGASAAGPITGTAALTFSNTGTLTGSGALAGAADMVFTATATALLPGEITGTSPLSFTAAGVLSGSGALSGVSSAAFSNSGDLTGAGALAGSSAVAFTTAGVLADPVSMTGVASMAFSNSATIGAFGALAGSADMAFAAFMQVVLDGTDVTGGWPTPPRRKKPKEAPREAVQEAPAEDQPAPQISQKTKGQLRAAEIRAKRVMAELKAIYAEQDALESTRQRLEADILAQQIMDQEDEEIALILALAS